MKTTFTAVQDQQRNFVASGRTRSRTRSAENLEAERRMRNRGDAARDKRGQQAEAEVFIMHGWDGIIAGTFIAYLACLLIG